MSYPCRTIVDFVREIHQIVSDDQYDSPFEESAEYYFRGESCNYDTYRDDEPSTKIDCSLDRSDPKKEREVYEEALRRNVASFEEDKTMVEQLARMQHYQLPTRFLDLSDNALQALYFACGGGSFSKNDNSNRDGFVRVFKISPKKMKSFTSDIIIGISHLPLVDAERVKPSEEKGLDGLAYEIKQHRPGFYTEDEWPEIGDYFRKEMQQVWAFKPILNNERIKVQSGLFLAYGCNDKKEPLHPDFSPANYMDQTKPSWGIKQIAAVRIASFAKKGLLEQLRMFGIRAESVYPDLSNVCQEIDKRFFPSKL